MTGVTADFMAALRDRLAERKRIHGHAFVTYEESRYLVQHDLHQPGHTRYRYSTPAADVSDAALARTVAEDGAAHTTTL
jgi:hypothetical protein